MTFIIIIILSSLKPKSNRSTLNTYINKHFYSPQKKWQNKSAFSFNYKSLLHSLVTTLSRVKTALQEKHLECVIITLSTRLNNLSTMWLLPNKWLKIIYLHTSVCMTQYTLIKHTQTMHNIYMNAFQKPYFPKQKRCNLV